MLDVGFGMLATESVRAEPSLPQTALIAGRSSVSRALGRMEPSTRDSAAKVDCVRRQLKVSFREHASKIEREELATFLRGALDPVRDSMIRAQSEL